MTKYSWKELCNLYFNLGCIFVRLVVNILLCAITQLKVQSGGQNNRKGGGLMEFEFLSEVIGDLVRRRRKELNLAQADVCRYAHISQGQLSRIENGLRIPSLSLMFRLCRVLNCDISISDIFDKFSSKDKNSKKGKKEDDEKKKGKDGEKS